MKIPLLSDHQFAQPWWLLLLLVLPLIAWLRGQRGGAPSMIFPTAFLLREVARPTRSAAGALVPSLGLISLGLGILALARPQKVTSTEESKTEGIAICLTVDVSTSMSAQDYMVGGVPTDRLTAAKRVMRDFIAGRKDDRIGIVAFAGEPYLPCPLTLDHAWLEENLERVQMGVVGDGTAIGSGIALATRRLDIEKKVKSKVIVLLTDGDENSGRLKATEAAKLAATLGIRIYTIAVGTAGDHYLPAARRTQAAFNEAPLKEVAAIAHGAFYRAQDSRALQEVFKTIDELEKTEVQKRVTVETDERLEFFALPAAAFLALGLLLAQTLSRRAPVVISV